MSISEAASAFGASVYGEPERRSAASTSNSPRPMPQPAYTFSWPSPTSRASR
ncbi:hypothetical protein [Micromonospora sp. CPCC 205714]|uniref:hypothetical protein n=1 Tax=Micromonospora sp. CPCC 205714 TaxID=3122402 RepID=UPI002FEE9748